MFPLLLIFYEFVLNMSNDMYTPGLPQIVTQLGTTYDLAQLTITSWLAGLAVIALFLGPLSDRFGRRPVLLIGGLFFILSTFVCTIAPNICTLIIARFFQGIAVCSFMITGYASVHELYPGKKGVHILAWMTSIAIVAPMVGPLIGGLILLVLSWRMTFAILLVLAIGVLLPLWRYMPESNQHPDPHALKLKRLFQVYGKIVSNPLYISSSLVFSMLYALLFVWISASPYLIMEQLHLRSDQFGWAQVPVFGAFFLGAQLVKPLMNRWSIKYLIYFGLFIALVGGVALVLWNSLGRQTLLSLLLPVSVITLGSGVLAAPLTRCTLTATSQKAGAAIAMFYLMMDITSSLGSVIVSVLKEAFVSVAILMLSLVVLSCFSQVVREIIYRRYQEK